MRTRLILTTAAALAVAGAIAGAAAAPAQRTAPRVTVMTRNLFLGADLLPLAAAEKGTPFERAVATALASVQSTTPGARMKLIAREIASAKPDLVGLQEVSRWSTGPLNSKTKPSHVVVDYLGVMMAELRRLHAPYRVAVRHLSLHLRAPSSRGVMVDFTDGNAILVRSSVTVRNARAADFRSLLRIPTKGIGTVVVSRSWASLDATVRGAHLHFVDTHLEAYSAAKRLDQAKELVAGPLRSRLQTVLVGDLNSGPNLPKAEDRPPFLWIRGAGFRDERTSRFNCCLNDDLRSGKWDHIVDHIMAKPALKLIRSFVTGSETTAAGRRPSDHGGVVSVLGFPR
jgi:endonuclease/exonuclease/phosphatase family metal-dependent hydrolase